VPGIVPYLHRVWGENLATFAAIRDRFDPDGMFLNPALERIPHHHDEPVHTE
jgi:FAD/FMN-containing dehydrogenase